MVTVLHQPYDGQSSLLAPLICPLRSSTININKTILKEINSQILLHNNDMDFILKIY